VQTDLDEAAARAALIAGFAASGWQELGINSPPGIRQNTGFVSATAPQIPLQLCHVDHGIVQVSMGTNAGTRLVNLTRIPGALSQFPQRDPVQPCNVAQQFQQPGFGQRGGVIDLMPRLVMPEAPAGRGLPFFAGGGGGGSQDDYESRTGMSTAMSIIELYAHFAAQLIEQGWAAEISMDGSFMATGSWQKTAENDVQLNGVLSVVELSDNNYDMRFRVLREGSAAPGAGVGVRFFTN
jgi:hypothetical protein